jgi:Uma2 family endonuclease
MATYEEQIAGQRFTSPSAPLRVEFTKTRLAAQINGSDDWCIVWTPEIHLEGDVVVPDLAGWRTKRMPPPDALVIEVVPDWVCEVVTAITERCDRVKKLPLYARRFVEYVWYIDPLARSLELWQRHGEYPSIVGGYEKSEIFRAEPFETVDIHLGALWLEE